MKKFSKLMAVILAVALCLSMLPMTAFADSENIKGTCTVCGVEVTASGSHGGSDKLMCNSCWENSKGENPNPDEGKCEHGKDPKTCEECKKGEEPDPDEGKCEHGNDAETCEKCKCTGEDGCEAKEHIGTCPKNPNNTKPEEPTCTNAEGCPVPGTGTHEPTCPRNPNYQPTEGGHTHIYRDNGDGTHSCTLECDMQKVAHDDKNPEDGKCDDCGAKVCEHNWGEWKTVTEAGCATEGTKERTCNDCKAVETETIDATGEHSWGEWKDQETGASLKPTCAEAGYKTQYRICQNTGCRALQTQKVTVPATGDHTPGEWSEQGTAYKAPTCSKEGSKSWIQTCTVCNAKVDSKIETIPATGKHEFKADPSKNLAATCTGNSATYEACEVCGYDRYIVAGDDSQLGHDWHDVEGTNTATCVEAGKKEQKCSRCGVTQEVEAEATGVHIHPIHHDPKPATCTEKGNIGYWECEDCGKKFTGGTNNVEVENVTTAAYHKYVDVPEEAATCTKAGVMAHMECEVCGQLVKGTNEVTREELTIDKLAHTAGYPQHENEEADGSYDLVVRCTVCNEMLSSEHVDPEPQPGYEIPETNVPLGDLPGDEAEIDEPDVPLAGLMTRAEFVNYLYVEAGSPAAELSTFTDVAEDHEYAKAIGWAQANGIAKGVGNNEFAPDDLVTVEQARLFLERYAESQGFEMPELTAWAGKDPKDILDNADEVLGEFFGEDAAEDAA